MMRTFCRNRFWKVESDQFIIIFCRSFDVPVKMIAVNRFELVLINTQAVWCWGRQNQTIHTENKSNPAWQWQPTVVFFNLFVAAVKPSATVCVARGTLCNDPGVYIAITALNCGGEFRSRQFRSVSANFGLFRRNPWQPLAELRLKKIGVRCFLQQFETDRWKSGADAT